MLYSFLPNKTNKESKMWNKNFSIFPNFWHKKIINIYEHDDYAVNLIFLFFVVQKILAYLLMKF